MGRRLNLRCQFTRRVGFRIMMKLLLVEDDEDSVELVKTALSMAKLPIELSVAYDGEEALRLLTKKPGELPDLMVLDLNLPKKNGRELIADMRTSPELRQLPVVLLTTTEWHDD